MARQINVINDGYFVVYLELDQVTYENPYDPTVTDKSGVQILNVNQSHVFTLEDDNSDYQIEGTVSGAPSLASGINYQIKKGEAPHTLRIDGTVCNHSIKKVN